MPIKPTVPYENDYLDFLHHAIILLCETTGLEVTKNKERTFKNSITLGILNGFLEAYSHSFPIFLSLSSATCKTQ